MKQLLLLIFAVHISTITTEEVWNCVAYEKTYVCLNSTNIKISESNGILKGNTFPKMSSIQSMEFVMNNLTDIEPMFFSKFPNLKELTIRGNYIFPNITRNLLQYCHDLITLKIYFNLKLNHVDVNVLRNFPRLKQLLIRSERIQHLRRHDFQVATHLRVLELDLTTLKKIDGNAFEPIGKMEKLSLMANNFLKINNEIFNWIPRLVELNLIYADITDLIFLRKLPKLQILKLAGNKISSISADTFEGLNNLRDLDLAHTGIKHIDTGVDFFKSVPNLKKIDITCHDLREELFVFIKLSEHGIALFDKYASNESRILSCSFD